jgi:uncharacterized membrane protein YfcA
MEMYLLLGSIILAIAILMSMVGKGGGNFYVLAMVLIGITMHEAAPTSQMIMLGTSTASMIIFHKSKKVDWKLALIIDPPTDIMAFLGGYLAGYVDGITLKVIFALLLIAVSIFMYIKVQEKPLELKNKFGYWNRTFGEHQYSVNLWLTIPITAMVGLFAGATGISGGAFKIPLMVMLCGIPMEIAVGTSSAMVAVTALMGLLGHSLHGYLNLQLAIPMTILAILGGIIGGKFALKSKPKNLKKIFAATNLAAGITMIISIVVNG